MAKSRERGTGSVYLPNDPKNPARKLQTYWISYYVDGKRKRESARTRKKSEAQTLLKRRMGEHALGLEIGDEEKRLTFENLEEDSAGVTRTADGDPFGGRGRPGIICVITSATGRRAPSPPTH